MLMLWFLSVLMLLYAHMGRLAIWDGAQWSLYLQAPLRPRTLLASKLQIIALLLLWPVVVAAAAGAQFFEVEWQTLGWFLLFALPGNVVALATIAMIGTWPWLVRREVDGRLSQGSRGLIGSIILVLCFYLLLSPAVYIWWKSTYRSQFVPGGFDRITSVGELALLATGYAAVVGSLALLMGIRNYRVLLRPR